MKIRTRQTRAPRGFTLLEMMLVVMIMGVLIGVAAWNIMSQGDKARKAATFTTMKTVQGMLDTYNLDSGMYPPTLDPLVPKYTAKMPVDAWKRPIIYSVTPGGAHPYVMFSYGPSGEQSAADQIDFWLEDQPAAPH